MSLRPAWIVSFIGAVVVAGVLYWASTDRAAGSSSATDHDIESAHTHKLDRAEPPVPTREKKGAKASLADAPINVIQQRLEPIARRGNLAAASELSRFAVRCHKVTTNVAALQTQMNDDSKHLDPQSKKARDSELNAKIDAVREFGRTHCETLPRAELNALASSAAKNAAALGDVDAQLCVIEQRFLEGRAPALTADERVHGWTRIAQYSDSAFERGDWRIVWLMAARTISIGNGQIYPMSGRPPGDPESYLRALQLLRLGADGAYALELDGKITEFVTITNPEMRSEGTGLSDDALADAKRWASEQFASNFSTSPRLTATPVPCVNE